MWFNLAENSDQNKISNMNVKGIKWRWKTKKKRWLNMNGKEMWAAGINVGEQFKNHW